VLSFNPSSKGSFSAMALYVPAWTKGLTSRRRLTLTSPRFSALSMETEPGGGIDEEVQNTQGICLPLSENTFYIAEWSPSENGQIDLEAINYYGVYVHRSQPGSGTIHIDEVRVANR
jgi:hypothetical protein